MPVIANTALEGTSQRFPKSEKETAHGKCSISRLATEEYFDTTFVTDVGRESRSVANAEGE